MHTDANTSKQNGTSGSFMFTTVSAGLYANLKTKNLNSNCVSAMNTRFGHRTSLKNAAKTFIPKFLIYTFKDSGCSNKTIKWPVAINF